MKIPPKLQKTIANLQTAITNIWRFLLGLLLLIIGVFLLALVIPAATAFYIITIGKKKQNIGQILVNNGSFLKLVAICIDIMGNVIGGSFFNWLLLKKAGASPFGIPGERMSSVIEWNFKTENLSEWGINLRHDLNTIQEDHCERSLLADIETYSQNLKKYKALLQKFETIERTKEFLKKYD